MLLSLNQIKPDDVLSFWAFCGFGNGSDQTTLKYVRVIKVGAKKIKVRCETGEEVWRYPHEYDAVVPSEEVAALIADGVKL